jgi:hypothetical protein
MESNDLMAPEWRAAKKRWILTLMALILTGCIGTTASQPIQPKETGSQPGQGSEKAADSQISPALDDYGAAPELQNEVWLNSETPLRLDDLQGKVILLEMWTFG